MGARLVDKVRGFDKGGVPIHKGRWRALVSKPWKDVYSKVSQVREDPNEPLPVRGNGGMEPPRSRGGMLRVGSCDNNQEASSCVVVEAWTAHEDEQSKSAEVHDLWVDLCRRAKKKVETEKT